MSDRGNIFDKPSEALATLAPNTKFKLKDVDGPGRPKDVLRPDGGDDWTAESFQTALSDGKIPRKRYSIRPLVPGSAKMGSRRVTLDLSMSEESTTIETTQPGTELQAPAGGGYHLQESVISLLRDSYSDEHALVWDLREQLDEKEGIIRERDTAILELKMKIFELEHSLAKAGETNTLNDTLNKSLVSFLGGPGAMVLARKLLGAGDAASTVAEALNMGAK